AAGYLFIRIIADAYYYLLKREGMGLGDGKLLAVIGALLGWKSLPVVLVVGSLLGTLISIPVLLAARRRLPAGDEGQTDQASLHRVQVPFGRFLSMAALVYLFAGDVIYWFLLGAPDPGH